MFNKLSSFFREDNGNFSATRLGFLSWILGVFIMWSASTIHNDFKLAEIPQSVQILIGVLMAGKVTQKFGEEKPDENCDK